MHCHFLLLYKNELVVCLTAAAHSFVVENHTLLKVKLRHLKVTEVKVEVPLKKTA